MEKKQQDHVEMKDFVEFIAKGLVDDPTQVKVNRIDGGKTTIYELSVAKADLGKIIGRQGRTAQAMRTLLVAVAAKQGTNRAILEILE